MSTFNNLNVSGGGASLSLNMGRLNGQYDQAQAWLDNQVIVDCTRYVPMNTGQLYRSAITGTKLGSGEVVWDAPHARKCYYGFEMNFRQDKHPDAQAQWFEAAKATCKTNWINMARKLAGGGK